jgi:hypothetical protein
MQNARTSKKSSSHLMQMQIQTEILTKHNTVSRLQHKEDITMVATTSTSTSTSRLPTLRREVVVREIDSTEKIPIDLEGKQLDKDMLGCGSSIRTLSLCSDDFEDSECNDNKIPEQARRSPLKVASASYIRSRFLNHLGISRPTGVQTEQHPKQTSLGPRSGSFCVKLKDKSLSSIPTVASSNTSMKRRVTFDVEVTVHPIPRFSSYSNRIRSTLWTPTAEVQANAARNCHEFTAEGWNWRTVAVDEEMVLYRGELIHPIHFVQEQECSMRQQFLQVMSARKR